MRHILTAGLLATLTVLAHAAPTWQTISSEPGKRIELDRTTLKREGNIVQAQGRVVLDKELSDFRTGAGYRVIEAITRYDCGTRNAKTIKRIYKKNETEVIREEDLNSQELPVRSGTLDDKVLREVCRPPKENQAELVRKANEAATQLKAANESTLKKELAKTDSAVVIKTADHGAADGGSIHSIKPNLKALAEATAKPQAETKQQPEPKPAPELTRVAATTHSAPPAHRPASAKKPKAAPPRQQEGYMLELTHADQAVHQHAAIHWDYEGAGGPENWARIDPKNKMCATGERQSPIDIRGGIGVDLEPIRFNYRPSTFRIEDNGHTVQVNVGDSTISLTGKTYELVQFHFHRPSEERINGERFDMVAHLVHKSEDGKLAVVAVLMKRGSENPFIQTLWNNLPLEQHMPVQPPSIAINPADLLPAERPYYTYMGSLTTPPCTEGVLWLVMKQPVQVSDEQIRIFSRLYSHNARPIQPVRDRLIKESR